VFREHRGKHAGDKVSESWVGPVTTNSLSIGYPFSLEWIASGQAVICLQPAASSDEASNSHHRTRGGIHSFHFYGKPVTLPGGLSNSCYGF
jgi:hypothetical protein